MAHVLRSDVRAQKLTSGLTLLLTVVWATPQPFVLFRIGVGLTLIFQALSLATVFWDFYGELGLIQGGLAAQLADPRLPSFFWLGSAWSDRFLTAFGASYLAALVALTLGWQPRLMAVTVWLMHWILTNTGSLHNYGADQIAHLSLFYLIWAPGPRTAPVPPRLLLTVMRLNLCIVYLASGWDKAQGVQWWNGEAIWRALMMPAYRHLDFTWLSDFWWMPLGLGWATLVVEAGYPLFIWWRRTRGPWLAMTVGLHLGIGLFLGLHVFAVLMVFWNLALFPWPRHGGEPVSPAA